MLTTYTPEPYVNFTDAGPKQKMQEALALVKSQLGRTYPLRIGGKRIETAKTIDSTNPANPSEVVGRVGRASGEQAVEAIKAADEAFKSWSRTCPDVRARYLLKAAAILKRRVYEFSAWMTYEVSKPWLEAYADTCEAIDFLDFYGREMMRLGGAHAVTPFAGEENELRYIPL